MLWPVQFLSDNQRESGRNNANGISVQAMNHQHSLGPRG
nr:MAG TPA: hypothetical protein [Caudoviricetes sp.]DAI64320.1 MAG TPA: hypothetical protein [Caudoviricetes sp.]DAY85866.1 MAG TPA: hypothetical protein [Caudoviricetes sp.]